jgi:8-oxo-dGTP pyrophosphatase MutT (NUDIX family)
VSAGGVVVRQLDGRPQVALICVGPRRRWQLPKGLVESGEAAEAAATREVREEAGVEAELVAPVETIEYWYVGRRGAERVRFHKRVHFYLFRYRSGDVADHDDEVEEARWVPADEAAGMLAFPNERRVVEKAVAALLVPSESYPVVPAPARWSQRIGRTAPSGTGQNSGSIPSSMMA